jgi:hypothetical protein
MHLNFDGFFRFGMAIRISSRLFNRNDTIEALDVALLSRGAEIVRKVRNICEVGRGSLVLAICHRYV